MGPKNDGRKCRTAPIHVDTGGGFSQILRSAAFHGDDSGGVGVKVVGNAIMNSNEDMYMYTARAI